MEFSRQEYWSALPCPSPGDLPNPGIKPRSPALQVDSLLFDPLGMPFKQGNLNQIDFRKITQAPGWIGRQQEQRQRVKLDTITVAWVLFSKFWASWKQGLWFYTHTHTHTHTHHTCIFQDVCPSCFQDMYPSLCVWNSFIILYAYK